MKTTVVIINWNGEKYLLPLLEALKHEHCKVLVIDNDSHDKSRLGKHKLCEYVQLNSNWGFAIGNNIGGALVTTENILFLNNDTMPKRGFLAEMEKNLYKDDKGLDKYSIVGAKLIFGDTKEVVVSDTAKFETTAGLVQHAGIDITSAGLPTEFGRDWKADDPRVTISRQTFGATGACLLIKTKLFQELRGFDTRFINGYEDVDLCWRAIEKGHQIWYEANAEVTHYCSATKGRFDKEQQNVLLLRQLWTLDRVNHFRYKHD